VRAHPDRLSAAVRALSARISVELDVPDRRFEIELVDVPFYASTALSWPDAPVRIRVSPDVVDSGVLAHEVTHGLVPTEAVFFAEGFATWKGCEAAGDCGDLLFADADVDDAVRSVLGEGRYVSIREFAAETTATRRVFAPQQVHRFETRCAHVCAASFVKWACQLAPGLPRSIAGAGCRAPLDELERRLGDDLPALEARWLASLLGHPGGGLAA
jgi:hypothetical protein